MRYVELIPGVRSSVLGFGCAPILGAVGASDAHRAICCALDCGITHFDMARSYGYGEAEAFVGRILGGRRDGVVLATKFGIRANWKAKLLRPLKPWVRMLRGTRESRSSAGTAGAPTATPGVGARFHDRVPLRGEVMRQSVELSLRALRTDYLDLLFVHEPTESLQHLEELSQTAAALKTEGKIRGWGLAFSWENVAIHSASLGSFDVLQFNNSPGVAHYEQIRAERAEERNVFFSPFRALPATMRPDQALRTLYTDFPQSVVLCSMFRTEHIRENARVAANPKSKGESDR